jgi:branched-chain amino acid transport system substrate-binding protein
MTKTTHSTSGRKTRRDILKTASTAIGAAGVWSLAPRVALAQKKTIKIGLVTPTTGPLAFFAECDAYVVPQFRQAVASGLKVAGTTYNVELIVKDSQSNPNRAAEVAGELILNDKVDLMLAAHTPETVNPVSDQCEINGVPCLTTDAPWQSWFFPRHGDPAKGFKWTYHFFFGLEGIGPLFIDLWNEVPTNKVVGVLWPNDTDGNAFADPKNGLRPFIEKGGYTVVDPGRFDPSIENFSSQIAAFKAANVEVFTSVLDPPVFTNFWTQCAQQGWRPKVMIPGKSVEFPPIIKTLGPLAKNLCIEVWWSPYHPFHSGLTGQSSQELADDYTRKTGKPWYMVLGYKHALFELAADILKRAKAVTPDAIRQSLADSDYHSIIGTLSFKHGPVPNVCPTPLVGGQWQQATNGEMTLQIVTNKEYPLIKTTAKELPL